MRLNTPRRKGARVPLFFLLSGEHPTLPFSELKSILEAEGYRYQVSESLTQVMRLEADMESVKAVSSRAALTRICGLELFDCDAAPSDIVEKMQKASLEGFLDGGESFVVRVRRVVGSRPHVVGMELERRLGGLILRKARGVKVSLKNPQKTFLGVLTGNRFVFGLKVTEVLPTPLIARRPRSRPFFQPSALPAKLARCMVNLAQPKAGEVVLDPFCGTGSILVEAGLMGCRVLGLDVQRHMVEGSLRNLLFHKVEPEGMAVADARRLPVSEADCIVTDPPYGISATTLGWSTKQIVKGFLAEIGERLPEGKRICIASPKTVGVGEIGKGLGLKHVESHFAYVHRSLTREIAVFEGVHY